MVKSATACALTACRAPGGRGALAFIFHGLDEREKAAAEDRELARKALMECLYATPPVDTC